VASETRQAGEVTQCERLIDVDVLRSEVGRADTEGVFGCRIVILDERAARSSETVHGACLRHAFHRSGEETFRVGNQLTRTRELTEGGVRNRERELGARELFSCFRMTAVDFDGLTAEVVELTEGHEPGRAAVTYPVRAVGVGPTDEPGSSGKRGPGEHACTR